MLDCFVPQGQEPDPMRPASVRRTGVLRVSPITTYGGLPQDGRNLPQDGQRSPQDGRGSPTRRSAPPLSSPLLSPIPSSLFRCAASVLFLLHNPLNKNTPNRGQIWLFPVHYNSSNLIIYYHQFHN